MTRPEQDVLGADVLVVEALRLLVGQRHDLPGPVRKSFKHVHLLLESALDNRQLLILIFGYTPQTLISSTSHNPLRSPNVHRAIVDRSTG